MLRLMDPTIVNHDSGCMITIEYLITSSPFETDIPSGYSLT